MAKEVVQKYEQTALERAWTLTTTVQGASLIEGSPFDSLLVNALSLLPKETLEGMLTIYTRVEQAGGLWIEKQGRKVPVTKEKELIEKAKATRQQRELDTKSAALRAWGGKI